MNNPVIKGAGYILAHAEDMIIHNGTTQSTERITNPDSEYLKQLPKHIRDYDSAMNYGPNQVYIGNMKPAELNDLQEPWYENKPENATRDGKFGEIMPQDEFIGLVKISDVFDLVLLTEEFTKDVKAKLEKHPLYADRVDRLQDGADLADIEKAIKESEAEAIYHHEELVGCVKRAHELDVNLNAHTMYENLVVKASGTLAMNHLIEKNDIDVEDIDYVIECSEEACGDINQRGGGNFAKAIAEEVGAINASGSDTRSFCAAPTHALIEATGLVKSGIHDNVVIVAGGSTAKLGMNGKDHVKKDMPVLEDVIGGFAILVSKNDGINPQLNTDLVGKHTVGTGSSPQAVITSLITEPLDRNDLKITDIDKYSVEMQNPEVTKPAGAGDVPTANYKMIAALGVKRGDLERSDINDFIVEHGMPGWAPTQGHIPSGVPYIGFAREELTDGDMNRVMVVGKGSLFLGRMTDLFDGVSIVIERNSGESDEAGNVSKDEIKNLIAESMRDLGNNLLSE